MSEIIWRKNMIKVILQLTFDTNCKLEVIWTFPFNSNLLVARYGNI